MKKQSSDWYIAATHYLTAGFVIPLLAGLVLAFLFAASGIVGVTQAVIMVFVSPVVVYFGVMYAAQYLQKTYVIARPSRIVVLATTYLAVISLGFTLASGVSAVAMRADIDMVILGLTLVTNIINIIVFYYASQKMVTVSA